MSDKPIAFLIYALAGIFIAIAPSVLVLVGPRPSSSFRRSWNAASGAVLLAFVMALTRPHFTWMMASFLFAGFSIAKLGDWKLTRFFLVSSALIASHKILWWQTEIRLPLLALLTGLLVLTSVYLNKSGTIVPSKWQSRLMMCGFGLLALLFSFSTGFYDHS